MPISGPVPEWLLSAVAATTIFAVMFDLGLAVVPGEFRWVVQRGAARRWRQHRREPGPPALLSCVRSVEPNEPRPPC